MQLFHQLVGRITEMRNPFLLVECGDGFIGQRLLAGHREDDAKQSAACQANCCQEAVEKHHMKRKTRVIPKPC